MIRRSEAIGKAPVAQTRSLRPRIASSGAVFFARLTPTRTSGSTPLSTSMPSLA